MHVVHVDMATLSSLLSVLSSLFLGLYYFYCNGDDKIEVYGSTVSEGFSNGRLLVTSNWPLWDGNYYPTNAPYPQSIVGVSLNQGDQYLLRARLINTGQNDFIEVPMRIDLTGPQPSFTDTFLHHHSLKDVQIIKLNMPYAREVQVQHMC